MPLNPDEETYLCDGLYISFDGFQFRLRAPRENGDHFVYLEPRAIKLFLEYIKQKEA